MKAARKTRPPPAAFSRPHWWDGEGEPVCLEGAAADALEWLIFLERNRPLGLSMDGQEKLGTAIAKLTEKLKAIPAP
jgi:hypothetical protein